MMVVMRMVVVMVMMSLYISATGSSGVLIRQGGQH